MELPNVEWAMPSRPPVINDGKVHVWRADLPDFADKESELFRLLSVDEQQRADKYHFEKDRLSFVIRRGMLRVILASYLDQHPAQIGFKYNNFNKPALEVNTQIFFNASSSQNVAIVAVTPEKRIGVDIEFLDEKFPKMEIAERYFSPDEVSSIRDLPRELQTAAFFECWTKKEAYVKAIGDGMSHPLPNLVISSKEPDSLSVDSLCKEARGWSITSFVPETNYIASHAYEAGQQEISYFRWPAI